MQGAGQDRLGIYIKSVVAGGAADAVSNYLLKKNYSIYIQYSKRAHVLYLNF